jgi:hypothetical protein
VFREIKIANCLEPVRQVYDGSGLDPSSVHPHRADMTLSFEQNRAISFQSQLVPRQGEIHWIASAIQCDPYAARGRLGLRSSPDSEKDQSSKNAKHKVRVVQGVSGTHALSAYLYTEKFRWSSG